MPRHGYDQRGLFRPQRPIPPIRQEQMGFRQGVRNDLNTRNMPLDASPRVENIRIVRESIQQDFALTKIGADSANTILAIAEHRYILSDIEFQRIFRVTRDVNGFVGLESWDGTQWIIAVSGSPTNLIILDTLVSTVSTQNKFVFCDGNTIYVWEEPIVGVIPVIDTFSGNILVTNGTSVQVELSKSQSDSSLAVDYTATLKFTPRFDPVKDPPIPEGIFTVSVDIVIQGNKSGSKNAWVELDRATVSHDFLWGDSAHKVQQTFTPTLPAVDVNMSEVFSMRVKVVNITLTSVEDLQKYLWAWSTGTQALTLAYNAFDDPGGAITVLSVDAPKASFIFPFEDRLLALGDLGDPQALSASADGDITKWVGIDTQRVSLLDTVHDPIDPVQALAMLSDNQAGLLRARNIMRVSETGDPLLPIAVQPWIEGIGTESPFSVAQTRDGIMFLAHNLMVYYWDGGSAPVPVGVPIHQDLIKALVSDVDKVTGVFDPIYEEYWLCTPFGTWILALGKFIDEQRLEWRTRTEIIKIAALVGRF